MTPIIRWFVENKVAANLLMMILVSGGLLALPQLYLEEFPEVKVAAVQIQVPYLGAAPQEVETAVCVRVEEALEGTEGVDTVRSTAAEGMCSIIAELVEGVDISKVANDIRSKVDAIDSFPAETERPITSEITVISKVIQIVVFGKTSEEGLRSVTQKLRDDLAALPGVSQVEMNFGRDFEISVEVSEANLRQFDLTLEEIGLAIAANSLDLPGGAIDTNQGEILVRTQGQAYRGQEFEDIIIRANPDGTRLTLAEVAEVKDGFVDADMAARFNGESAMALVISRVGTEDTIEIADTVKAYIDQLRPTLPEGLNIEVWKDESQDLTDRLQALVKNARSGLILVLIVLALFLQFRLALWVAAGIPIALLGTLAIFPGLGVAISTMSIMGFILVIGILVDDAIVVGERIFAHEEMGKPRLQAAIDGTSEVSTPVIFGVLTTMATFIPIMNIPGEIGGFFLVIGTVVVIALFFSIFESQLILPHHLAHRRLAHRKEDKNRWQRIQGMLSDRLDTFASDTFSPWVARAIEYRYTTLALGVAVLIIALGALLSGRILFQFFPSVDGSRIYASVVLPEGTPIETTARVVQRMEDSAEQLRQELDAIQLVEDQSSITKVYTAVGTLLPKGSVEFGTPVKTNIAEVAIQLNIPSDYEGTPVSVFANRWRELTGPIPDAVEVKFTATSFSIGAAIDIELFGTDFDELKSVANELKTTLASYPGVVDISDSFRSGKQEIKLSLKPEARYYGISLANLGLQVRHAFYGYEAQRIQRGKDDIRVMVRYPEGERDAFGSIESMFIRTPGGAEVPFSSIANIEIGEGFTTISRVDGQRVINVTAEVMRDKITPEQVLSGVFGKSLPEITKRHPGVSYSLAGEAEDRAESMNSLGAYALLALLVIYALLAVPLQSYLQPLVIMSVIPFGAIGAIFGHFVMGADLTFLSVLGIVALSGVVVNSSLVLVDYVNRQRAAGTDLHTALVSAGVVRFRPILLTSLTTFIGLLPMVFDKNTATLIFVPLAISLAFGVLVGTVITLFLVPSLYHILEDVLTAKPSR